MQKSKSQWLIVSADTVERTACHDVCPRSEGLAQTLIRAGYLTRASSQENNVPFINSMSLSLNSTGVRLSKVLCR